MLQFYLFHLKRFLIFFFFTFTIFLFLDLLPSKTSSQTGQLSKSDISGPYPQSKNLAAMTNQETSSTRPLPPVPHINL